MELKSFHLKEFFDEVDRFFIELSFCGFFFICKKFTNFRFLEDDVEMVRGGSKELYRKLKRFEKSVFSETNESGLNINIRFEEDRINEKEKKNFVCCFFKMLRFKYQASF